MSRKIMYSLIAAVSLLTGISAEAADEWKNGIIADQTFLVSLSEFGKEVWFASYAPDQAYADVSLKIIQDDMPVEVLDEYLPASVQGLEFTGLDAVSFTDYNEDGNTDILVIKTFGSTTIPVVYSGTSQGEKKFILESTLSARLSANLSDMTISAMTEYLKQIRGESSVEVEELPEEAVGEYVFSSGVGAWWSVLRLKKDGSFTGSYSDTDMTGGEGYEATQYYCDYSGRFDRIRKINDHIYLLHVPEIETMQEIGTQYISESCLYVCSEPAGMKANSEYYLYLPMTPESEMPVIPSEWWTGVTYTDTQPRQSINAIIYHPSNDTPFVKQ